jgi:hypothetical protein
MVKACGVAMAMLPGYSWTPRRSSDDVVNERKHRRTNWGALLRRYCDQAGWPRGQDAGMFNPEKVGTTRYRYRGAAIPSPWPLAAISISVA